MYRIKMIILAIIVAAMVIHLYFISNKSIVEPIGYSGCIKMVGSQPVNYISALKFPYYEDKKYIYAFILDEDKLNYKRYDIENGKEISIDLPKNKNLFIFAEESSLDEANWSWCSNFTELDLKGKFAKSIEDGSTGIYGSFLKEIKGEQLHHKYFQFFGENKGKEKILLIYGGQVRDYMKIPVIINVN